MFLVCANHEDDFEVLGVNLFSSDAESVVLSKVEDIAEPGDELVKIVYQGDMLYTTRYKPVVVPDQYEYVDNDGNPINADGSDIVEGAPVEEIPYEYYSTVWIIKPISLGQPIELSASEHYSLSSGTDSPFRTHESLTLLKTFE